LIAGPFASRLLADFGAEVIKVEAPGNPDPLRQWGSAHKDGEYLWWSVQSRNKKLVTLDLRTERGRELLMRIVEQTDIIIENFRPGTLERWGMGPAELLERNPSVIVTRISGYGQDGPDAHKPGYASVAEAVGGLRYLNGYPDQTPPRFGISLGDSLGSLFGCFGALLALRWRDQNGGRGQVADISLVESCFALLESAIPEFAATCAIRGPSGAGLNGIAPSNLFRSKDGVDLVIAANQDTVFKRLVAAMGQPELAHDPRFVDHVARGRHQHEIERIVGDWACQLSLVDLVESLDAAGVPNGPVNSVADIFGSRLFAERGLLVEVPDEVLGEIVHPGVVPKLSDSPGTIRHGGRRNPGHDNSSVFGDLLGLTDAEIADLVSDRII
jgi:crotonobetainyl-CoA:carnitine CoA-transferase CaiB-like acyl-CoA transferase